MVFRQKYLTEDGVAKLKAERQELFEVKRPEVIARIKTALAQGDLSENAEYAEAKESQAFVEGRIKEIDDILKNVEVVKNGGRKSSIVKVGSKVDVRANGTEQEFTIVGVGEADPLKGLISNESPMGQAFLGKKKGDQAVVETPAGQKTFKITKVH